MGPTGITTTRSGVMAMELALAIDQKLVIEIRNVYGVEKVYPVCEKAHTFAEIAGTKTLTVEVLDRIKALGYELTLEQKSGLAQAIGVK